MSEHGHKHGHIRQSHKITFTILLAARLWVVPLSLSPPFVMLMHITQRWACSQLQPGPGAGVAAQTWNTLKPRIQKPSRKIPCMEKSHGLDTGCHCDSISVAGLKIKVNSPQNDSYTTVLVPEMRPIALTLILLLVAWSIFPPIKPALINFRTIKLLFPNPSVHFIVHMTHPLTKVVSVARVRRVCL